MKKLIRKILVIMALTVMEMPLISNAGFQANKGGTSYKTSDDIYANDLFEGIRNMEAEGGTLGLSAKIQETSYLEEGAEEGKGNGLDCHMAKNTEWGTAAMLAASIYGEAPSGQSEESTTRNDSGIFQMANRYGYEIVAGIYDATNDYMGKIKSANEIYFDLYIDSTISKPGDATTETKKWKKGSCPGSPSISFPMFLRNYEGLFGYWAHDGLYGNKNYRTIK